MIYRKFSWLHNRLLLHYQDELALLEEKLEWLDKSDSLQDPYFVMNRRRDEKRPDSQRGELLTRIDEKLAQYRKYAYNNRLAMQSLTPSQMRCSFACNRWIPSKGRRSATKAVCGISSRPREVRLPKKRNGSIWGQI